MKAKLLRALAHIKAAQHHLELARDLITQDNWRPLTLTNAINGAIAAAEGSRVETGSRYARVVYDGLQPAELP